MLKQVVLRYIWHRPLLYQAIQKLRSRGDLLDPNYDLLLDGFPRSGNTFASLMIEESQQSRLKVVTHRHTPPPFLHAVKIGKPACLTLRRPFDAITSWVIYTNRPIRSVIQYYLDFHQILLPYRSKFLIVPFFILTEDFSLVLQLINARFALNLKHQFDLEACKREVFGRIDNSWKNGDGIINEFRVARPYTARDNLKAAIQKKLLHPRYSASLQSCRDLYQIYEDDFFSDLDRCPVMSPHKAKIESYSKKFHQPDISDDFTQTEYAAA
jgi:hypothetical protein